MREFSKSAKLGPKHMHLYRNWNHFPEQSKRPPFWRVTTNAPYTRPTPWHRVHCLPHHVLRILWLRCWFSSAESSTLAFVEAARHPSINHVRAAPCGFWSEEVLVQAHREQTTFTWWWALVLREREGRSLVWQQACALVALRFAKHKTLADLRSLNQGLCLRKSQ